MTLANETKIGIMVVICLAALGLLTIKVGNFTFYKERYDVYISFENAGGIKLHAPLRISGVEVGEVSNVEPPNEGNNYRVVLTISIDEGIKIRKDAKCYVTMLGLMGEKYIEVTAGTAKADFVKAGDTLIGKDPIVMEELFQTVDEGVGELKDLVANVNNAVVDNRGHLDNSVANLESATQNLDDFTEDIKANPWKLFFRSKEKKTTQSE